MKKLKEVLIFIISVGAFMIALSISITIFIKILEFSFRLLGVI